LVIGHYIYQGAITWSPDGKFLLFAGPSENERTRSHVSLLNVETLETKRLPDPSENCQFITFPVLSPDGRALAEACQLTFGLSSIYLTPFPMAEPATHSEQGRPRGTDLE
jgi:sugar lactone lactonase YvrE